MSKKRVIAGPRGFIWECHKFEDFLVPVGVDQVSVAFIEKFPAQMRQHKIRAVVQGHGQHISRTVRAAKKWVVTTLRLGRKR